MRLLDDDRGRRIIGIWRGAVVADDAADAAIEALQEVQDIVGNWNGLGAKSDKSAEWAEKIDCQWKFGKDGAVALQLAFANQTDKEKGRLLEKALLTYDPAKKVYRLQVFKQGDGAESTPLEFEGKRQKAGLLFDRVKKAAAKDAKDAFDRLDLKVLNDGDRIVYSLHRRVGQSRTYRTFAQVGLVARERRLPIAKTLGQSASSPAAGTLTVSFDGQDTSFVAPAVATPSTPTRKVHRQAEEMIPRRMHSMRPLWWGC